MTLRVLIADDHQLFAEGLRNLLRAGGMEVVGMASNGLEALYQAQAHRPDVVLMDIQMPRCDGLQALRLIRQKMPEVKVVMLTMSEDDTDLFTAIKYGAAGYLLKNLDSEEFFQYLACVARDEAALPPTLAAKVLEEFARPTRSPAPSAPAPGAELTERQLEVLRLIAAGCTNREIAHKLFITERTVKYHTREILQKLQLRNRAEAVAYAIRSELVTV